MTDVQSCCCCRKFAPDVRANLLVPTPAGLTCLDCLSTDPLWTIQALLQRAGQLLREGDQLLQDSQRRMAEGNALRQAAEDILSELERQQKRAI